MDIEKFLINAFDYQRFENEPELARIISETERRCKKALSDDALALVNAAGNIHAAKKERKDIEDG